MKRNILFKVIKISSSILSLFNVLFFFAMRCCWSGISKTLGYEKSNSWLILNLPIIVFVILILISIANIILFFTLEKTKNKWAIIFLIVDIVFLIANIVIVIMGAIDYIQYVMIELLKSLVVLTIALLFIFLLFIYPKTPLKDNKVFKMCCLVAIILSSSAFLLNVTINYISCGAVVYAVEDTYQIVFSSNTDSMAWVNIDGKEYADLNAGSKKSYTKIHKVEVPMEVLDNAKSYSIHCQKLIYRGPFGGIKGKEIVKEYNFKPVDSSDGLSYFSLSDIHMELDGSIKVASYATNKEFLVLAGDVISMMDTFDDANYTNKVANKLTNGEIPVVYARGNHEVKGKYSEEFYKFVGSKNGQFYYNFYLDGIYGIVLDIGEDHDDDWWEYYGTANYDEYRQKQIDFLNNEISKRDFESYDYRLVVCHIPLVYVNSRHNHEYAKKEITKALNQMDIDMVLSGHQHQILVFEPNTIDPYEKLTYNPAFKKGTYKGYVTDYNFPNLLISKRGFTQTDSATLTLSSQIGLNINVDFTNSLQTCTYINGKGEKVNIVNPYVEKDYGEEIKISLVTKVFE